MSWSTVQYTLPLDFVEATANAMVRLDYRNGLCHTVKGRVSFQKDSQTNIYRFRVVGYRAVAGAGEIDTEEDPDVDQIVDLPLMFAQIDAKKFKSQNGKARAVLVHFPL